MFDPVSTNRAWMEPLRSNTSRSTTCPGTPTALRRFGITTKTFEARPPNDDDEDPRSADDDEKDEDNEEDDDEEDPPPVAVKVVWTSKRTRTMARKRGSRVIPAWLTACSV